MSAPSIETVQSWQGRTMVDPAGDKLGTIATIYLDDEAELYRHYGLDYSEHRSDSGLPAGTADDRADVDRDTVGRDTSGPTTDEAMTRSEGGAPGRARADHRRQPGGGHQRPRDLRGRARGHPARGDPGGRKD
jgi:hypothetical protein